jgi:hypothetical protein
MEGEGMEGGRCKGRVKGEGGEGERGWERKKKRKERSCLILILQILNY